MAIGGIWEQKNALMSVFMSFRYIKNMSDEKGDKRKREVGA